MGKLLLLSVVIAMLGIPLACARTRNPRAGLRKMLVLVVAYNLFYLFAVRFIYPHLL